MTGQTLAGLRHLALNGHTPAAASDGLPCMISRKAPVRPRVAERTARRPQTVMDSLHAYSDTAPRRCPVGAPVAPPCPVIEAALTAVKNEGQSQKTAELRTVRTFAGE